MSEVKSLNPGWVDPRERRAMAPPIRSASELAEEAGEVFKEEKDKANLAKFVAKIDELKEAKEKVRLLEEKVKAMSDWVEYRAEIVKLNKALESNPFA